MIDFLRENRYASYALTMLRLYIGWQWLHTGWEKISGGFDASGFLFDAVKKSGGEHPAVQSWWADFLSGFAIHNIEVFNVLIPWGEFLVGIGLIIGCFTIFAALMGAVMNFSYMYSGTVSTSPQMVLIEMLLLMAGTNAARIGVDYWIILFFTKRTFTRKFKFAVKKTV